MSTTYNLNYKLNDVIKYMLKRFELPSVYIYILI